MKTSIKVMNRIAEAVRNFAKYPIDSLGVLIPTVMVVIAMISSTVGYVLFINTQGYSNQITLIKERGIEGVFQGFTAGSSIMMADQPILLIVGILFLIQLIIMVLSFFRNEGKAKKIFMVTDLILVVALTIFTIVKLNSLGSAGDAQNVLMTLLFRFNEIDWAMKTFFVVYMGFLIFTMIMFGILVLTSRCKWFLGYAVVGIIISYIIIPLFFLILENIIPLGLGLLLFAVVYGAIWLYKNVFSTGESSTQSSTSELTHHTYKAQNATEKDKSIINQSNQKVREFNINTTFWRDKGGYGIGVPQNDCIYYTNNIGTKVYICTVEDYEKGKVAILHKGVRMMKIAGCITPKR